MDKDRLPRDSNQRAFAIVQKSLERLQNPEARQVDKPNAAAKDLGSRGGLSRAQKLTPAQRSEIAKRAAEKRWAKNKG